MNVRKGRLMLQIAACILVSTLQAGGSELKSTDLRDVKM